MSKFNNYAKKLNEIAHTTFTEYREKSDAVKSAESKYRAYPWRDGADPTYLAKSARAKADLAEANAQFEHCRRHLFEEQQRDIAVIRAELVEALNKEYAADPKAVDMQTLSLKLWEQQVLDRQRLQFSRQRSLLQLKTAVSLNPSPCGQSP